MSKKPDHLGNEPIKSSGKKKSSSEVDDKKLKDFEKIFQFRRYGGGNVSYETAVRYARIGILPHHVWMEIEENEIKFTNEAELWTRFAGKLLLDKGATEKTIATLFYVAVKSWKASSALQKLEAIYESFHNSYPSLVQEVYNQAIKKTDLPLTIRYSEENVILELPYELPYTATVENTPGTKIAELPVAQNTEALIRADELYILLSSLISIHDPEPDYMGIRDITIINSALRESLEKLPKDGRQFFADDETLIKMLVERDLYEAARQVIYQRYEEIRELLSDGREPPPQIKAILETLPKVEF